MAFASIFPLMLIATLVSMLAQRVKIPYAISLVVVGLLVGAPHLIPDARLDPHVLFTVLLPPLLFESSLHLRLNELKEVWKPTAIFAVAGTILSTLIVGSLCHLLLGIPWASALLFGALISSTDPISVLALFKQLGVGKRLSLLMESESLFNDGIAVVLFSILVTLAEGGDISAAGGVEKLLVVALGGAAIGTGLGFFASRITEEFDDHLLELMLTTVVAYGSYLCAEYAHTSGVIAVVAAGLIVGNHGMRRGMSATTRLTVLSFWEFAAFVVNSIVFLLVGIQVTLVDLHGNSLLVLTSILIVPLARAIVVYGLAPLSALVGTSIPSRWQHVLFWGGLRGALSMALALGLSSKVPFRDELIVMTFGVVLSSLLLQGLTVGKLISFLGLVERDENKKRLNELAADVLTARSVLSELEGSARAGHLPPTILDPLRAEYQGRLSEAENRVQELWRERSDLRLLQELEGRVFVLKAERVALQEALMQGLIDEEAFQTKSAGIDRELSRLSSE